MSIAVIKTGGKQYKVEEGEILLVEKIERKDGEIMVFDDLLDGKKVEIKVVEQTKGPKIHIFKFRQKTREKKKTGHRQQLTKISIESIK